MKKYQKAEMIAKNLPTGSYAAGCPTGTRLSSGGMDGCKTSDGDWHSGCSACELVK